MNVLIVDDEPLAHEVLLHHCGGHADVKVVGRCYNAAEALKVFETTPIDLMFLDIRMPRFGGLDLLRGLALPPLTVVVSAHKEHALDGFELDVVDYLLKPVNAERFASALEKVRRRLAAERPEKDDYVVLKVDRALRRFRLDGIVCLEAQGNFVKVFSDDGVWLATVTLRRLLLLLPTSKFVQIHKSYIVNRKRITELRTSSLSLDNNMSLPIGRRRRSNLFP